MTTQPEEDDCPTIVFPTINQQCSHGFDNPYDQPEYEIGEIEVSCDDKFQNKDGKGKIADKSNKSIQQIQKELAQKMNIYSIFTYDLMKISNGSIKKLYLLLYNTTYYCFGLYQTYRKVQKDSKLFEMCCKQTQKLHKQLVELEKVEQISDRTSLQIMNLMKQNVDKMLEEYKLKQKEAENEAFLEKQTTQKDIQNQNQKVKTDKQESPKDISFDYFNKQIERFRELTIVVEFQKLLLEICKYVELNPKIDLIMFEHIIEKYLQKLIYNFQSSHLQEILFIYFREMLNTPKILNKFNLFKAQLQSLTSLIKQLKNSYSLALQDDKELSKQIPIHINQIMQTGSNNLVEITQLDTTKFDNRNQYILKNLL